MFEVGTDERVTCFVYCFAACYLLKPHIWCPTTNSNYSDDGIFSKLIADMDRDFHFALNLLVFQMTGVLWYGSDIQA